ncbi:MAG: hypothetical protein IT177_19950 [Acidobacteria bacterium]|nr:hypothetical protein [Acidobacteriota bacterium]
MTHSRQLAVALVAILALPVAARAQTPVTVVIETSAGVIEVALEPARAADGQGFAALGRVVSGMEVVRALGRK